MKYAPSFKSSASNPVEPGFSSASSAAACGSDLYLSGRHYARIARTFGGVWRCAYFLFGARLRSINVTQSNRGSVVFEEVVGLLGCANWILVWQMSVIVPLFRFSRRRKG